MYVCKHLFFPFSFLKLVIHIQYYRMWNPYSGVPGAGCVNERGKIWLYNPWKRIFVKTAWNFIPNTIKPILFCIDNSIFNFNWYREKTIILSSRLLFTILNFKQAKLSGKYFLYKDQNKALGLETFSCYLHHRFTFSYWFL